MPQKFSRLKSTLIVAALVALAVAVSVGSSSCKTVQPVVDEVTHVALDCGKPAIKDVALHLLDDVTSALVTADYAGGIRGIVAGLVKGVAEAERQRALESAWSAAACAVDEVNSQAGTHLAYGHMDPETQERQVLIRAHATAWLGAHR